MSEQQWRLVLGRGLNQRSSVFWSPSQHAARNLASQEAQGRPFQLNPICPHCDLVIADGEPRADDGRYCHVECLRREVTP